MSVGSIPSDLLEQARHLSSREPKRPKQASLRRAISAAYYALFHQLTSDAADLLGPNLEPEFRARIQRWFDHRAIKLTCDRFIPAELEDPLRSLLGPRCSSEMRLIARHFIDLQDARHRADYDMSLSLTRAEALTFVQRAENAIHAWKAIRKSAEANLFLVSFLLWEQLKKQR